MLFVASIIIKAFCFISLPDYFCCFYLSPQLQEVKGHENQASTCLEVLIGSGRKLIFFSSEFFGCDSPKNQHKKTINISYKYEIEVPSFHFIAVTKFNRRLQTPSEITEPDLHC